MPLTKVTFPQGSEAHLAKLPEMVREKSVKKAIRRVATVIAKDARIRAKALDQTEDDETKEEKPESERLYRNIGRSAAKLNGNKVKIQVRSLSVANLYASAVEFGHIMSGKFAHYGGRVQPWPFMRPAIDHTKEEQDRVMIASLREDIDTYLK